MHSSPCIQLHVHSFVIHTKGAQQIPHVNPRGADCGEGLCLPASGSPTVSSQTRVTATRLDSAHTALCQHPRESTGLHIQSCQSPTPLQPATRDPPSGSSSPALCKRTVLPSKTRPLRLPSLKPLEFQKMTFKNTTKVHEHTPRDEEIMNKKVGEGKKREMVGGSV